MAYMLAEVVRYLFVDKIMMMRFHVFPLLCLSCALSLMPAQVEAKHNVAGSQAFKKPSTHTLWYTQPAPTDYSGWQEYSLPIGNGEFGGSIFGGIETDKIIFNEKSLWAGTSTTQPNPNHGEYLKFGSIWVKDLSDNPQEGVKNYVRYLDIERAVAGVKFTGRSGESYTRTYVSSHPGQVLAARYEVKGHARMNLNFTVVPGGQLVALSEKKPVVSYADGSARFQGKLQLLSYAAQMSLVADPAAEVTTSDEGITVRNAREIRLYVAGGTDYDANNTTTFTNGTAAQLPNIMNARIKQACSMTWKKLMAEHVADFRSYMDRAAITFKKDGKEVNSLRPTNELIDRYGHDIEGTRNGAEGLFLEQLYYNYGRYLLISSNRHQPVPNNLQGLWVDTDRGHAPWNSDIHTNINIQMNYWPCEVNNLSDLHMPLLNHIVSISNSPGCKEQARRAGQSVGWVVNTESNLFGGMSSWSANYTIANAWYVTHLWNHYRYTLDKDYLRRVFPTMWSAAQYWAERLVLASDGTYECPNEFSPEHGHQAENATAHSQQLVCELFANTLAAVDALGNENELDGTWLTMIRDRYAKADRGLHVETYEASSQWGEKYLRYGEPILREWKYSPFTVGQNAHRHTSHLMALYPFSQIQPGDKYFQPAVNALSQRSDASTGWAMGWRVNLWARAQDGNHARRMINNALCHAGSGLNYSSGGVYYNLWDAHTPFQIDGNFGVCAGIAEMLIQSTEGTIRLLPALPDTWREGSFRGLKAVGGYTVSATWKDGKVTSYNIINKEGKKVNPKSINIIFNK